MFCLTAFHIANKRLCVTFYNHYLKCILLRNRNRIENLWSLTLTIVVTFFCEFLRFSKINTPRRNLLIHVILCKIHMFDLINKGYTRCHAVFLCLGITFTKWYETHTLRIIKGAQLVAVEKLKMAL